MALHIVGSRNSLGSELSDVLVFYFEMCDYFLVNFFNDLTISISSILTLLRFIVVFLGFYSLLLCIFKLLLDSLFVLFKRAPGAISLQIANFTQLFVLRELVGFGSLLLLNVNVPIVFLREVANDLIVIVALHTSPAPLFFLSVVNIVQIPSLLKNLHRFDKLAETEQTNAFQIHSIHND